MKLTLMGVATSAAVGAADIGLEELDARQGLSKPFENATDLVRTAEVLGGAALNYANIRGTEAWSDTLVYSSLPLFEKSLYRAARQAMGGSTTVHRAGATARAVTVRVAAPSGLQPVATPGGFRSITA